MHVLLNGHVGKDAIKFPQVNPAQPRAHNTNTFFPQGLPIFCRAGDLRGSFYVQHGPEVSGFSVMFLPSHRAVAWRDG